MCSLEILKFCFIISLDQLVNENTIGNDILDLVFVNDKQLVAEASVTPPFSYSGSSHVAITLYNVSKIKITKKVVVNFYASDWELFSLP